MSDALDKFYSDVDQGENVSLVLRRKAFDDGQQYILEHIAQDQGYSELRMKSFLTDPPQRIRIGGGRRDHAFNWWHPDSSPFTFKNNENSPMPLPNSINLKMRLSRYLYPRLKEDYDIEIKIIPKRRISEHFYDTVVLMRSDAESAEIHAFEVAWAALWDAQLYTMTDNTPPIQSVANVLFLEEPDIKGTRVIEVDIAIDSNPTRPEDRSSRIRRSSIGRRTESLPGWIVVPGVGASRSTYCGAVVGIGIAFLGSAESIFAFDCYRVHLSWLAAGSRSNYQLSNPSEFLQLINRQPILDIVGENKDRNEVVLGVRNEPAGSRQEHRSNASIIAQIMYPLVYMVSGTAYYDPSSLAQLNQLHGVGFLLASHLNFREVGLAPSWKKTDSFSEFLDPIFHKKSESRFEPAKTFLYINLTWLLKENAPMRQIRDQQRVIAMYSTRSGRFIYPTSSNRFELSIYLPESVNYQEFGSINSERMIELLIPAVSMQGTLGGWTRLPVFEILMVTRGLTWADEVLEGRYLSKSSSIVGFEALFEPNADERKIITSGPDLPTEGCLATWTTTDGPEPALQLYTWRTPPDLLRAYRWHWRQTLGLIKFHAELDDFTLIASTLAAYQDGEARGGQPDRDIILISVPIDIGKTGVVSIKRSWQHWYDGMKQSFPLHLRSYVVVLGKVEHSITWPVFKVEFQASRFEHLEVSCKELGRLHTVSLPVVKIGSNLALQIQPNVWIISTERAIVEGIKKQLETIRKCDLITRWLPGPAVATKASVTEMFGRHPKGNVYFQEVAALLLQYKTLVSNSTVTVFEPFQRCVSSCIRCRSTGDLTALPCHPHDRLKAGHLLKQFWTGGLSATRGDYGHCAYCKTNCLQFLSDEDKSRIYSPTIWVLDPVQGCRRICCLELSSLHSADEFPGCGSHQSSAEFDSDGYKIMTEAEVSQADHYRDQVSRLARDRAFGAINGPGQQIWPSKGINICGVDTAVSNDIPTGPHINLGCNNRESWNSRQLLMQGYDTASNDLAEFRLYVRWVYDHLEGDTRERPSNLQNERIQELARLLCVELPDQRQLQADWFESNHHPSLKNICAMFRFTTEAARVCIKRRAFIDILEVHILGVDVPDCTPLSDSSVQHTFRQAIIECLGPFDQFENCIPVAYVHQWQNVGHSRTFGELKQTLRRIHTALVSIRTEFIWVDQLVNWLPLPAFGVSWGGLEHDVYHSRFPEERINVELFAPRTVRYVNTSFWASWELRRDPTAGLVDIIRTLPIYVENYLTRTARSNGYYRTIHRDDLVLIGMLWMVSAGIRASVSELGHEGQLTASLGGAAVHDPIVCVAARAGFVSTTDVRAAIYHRDMNLSPAVLRPAWLTDSLAHWMSVGSGGNAHPVVEGVCVSSQGVVLGRTSRPADLPEMLHYRPTEPVADDPGFPAQTRLEWVLGLH